MTPLSRLAFRASISLWGPNVSTATTVEDDSRLLQLLGGYTTARNYFMERVQEGYRAAGDRPASTMPATRRMPSHPVVPTLQSKAQKVGRAGVSMRRLQTGHTARRGTASSFRPVGRGGWLAARGGEGTLSMLEEQFSMPLPNISLPRFAAADAFAAHNGEVSERERGPLSVGEEEEREHEREQMSKLGSVVPKALTKLWCGCAPPLTAHRSSLAAYCSPWPLNRVPFTFDRCLLACRLLTEMLTLADHRISITLDRLTSYLNAT